MGMTAEAQEVRREYKRQYRRKNRDRINRQQREWRANNLEKARQYQERYWENAAKKQKKNIRASYADYGIDKKRLEELQELVRSGQYDDLVLSAALSADERAARHIIASVKERIPYEFVEFSEKYGRCILGRTDFYGVRRLFFHYFDEALRKSI